MRRRSRWIKLAVKVGLAGAIVAVGLSPATGTPADSGQPSAISYGSCEQWGCGENHNQVLL
jgi:hypothetical protein